MKTIAERFIESQRQPEYIIVRPQGVPHFYTFRGSWSPEESYAKRFTSLEEAKKLAKDSEALVVQNYGMEDQKIIADYVSALVVNWGTGDWSKKPKGRQG